ncbi:acyl transferase/acyl hydrolase/lysophospholipase, partial [Pyronema omphalodes]
LMIDGGGVRGFSTLLLIQELMLNLFVEIEGRAPRPEELPKPCDHFDLIAGSGVGGILAILLGRLRLDIETTKEIYTSVSKAVFESDKTIGGLPYKKTLFKASRLEESLKALVAEHIGRDPLDGEASCNALPKTPSSSSQPFRSNTGYSSSTDGSTMSGSMAKSDTPGDGEALLLDTRPDRCKVFVTATYKGSDVDTPVAFLRTYESAHSSSPSPKCTVWQAGRATAAHHPAFKPIQIGHEIFIDEGPGPYSPVMHLLEEALVHEWPGREIGVLISIGTGMKASTGDSALTSPTSTSKSLLQSSFLGKFADAKQKHEAKMMRCEEIHQELLANIEKTGVARENYIRLNVEREVGDYGINEWRRFAEISTSTRKYLSRHDIHSLNQTAAEKLAALHHLAQKSCEQSIYDGRELPSLPKPDAVPRTAMPEMHDVSHDEEIRRHQEELRAIAMRLHGDPAKRAGFV